MTKKTSQVALPKTLLAVLSFLLILAPAAIARGPAKVQPARGFDRSKIMLINLKSGQGSTGQTLTDSAREASLMVKKLKKALHQLEQAEKAYAKSRNRPDDRFLLSPAVRIKQAKETAEKLETELDSASNDLNASIREILILEHK